MKKCVVSKRTFLRFSTRFITGHKESQFAAQSRNVLIIFQLIINFPRKKGKDIRIEYLGCYLFDIATIRIKLLFTYKVYSNIYCTKWPSQFLLIEINWFPCLFWSKQKDVVYPFNPSFFCKYRGVEFRSKVLHNKV